MQKRLFAGEDPRLALKRLEVQQTTQHETQVFAQLQDGQVPSFEKFMALKDKIKKTNEGEYGRNTPLKVKESKEQAMAQYQKLNDMITEKNL